MNATLYGVICAEVKKVEGPFTSDWIRSRLARKSRGTAALLKEVQPNDWGRMIQRLKKDGLIKPYRYPNSGWRCYTRSIRPEGRSHIMAVWVKA